MTPRRPSTRGRSGSARRPSAPTTLWDTGEDRARALALARQAADDYGELADDESTARARRWLATRQ